MTYAEATESTLGGSCPALIEAAHPEVYRRNAFRLTGLSVEATPRDISRHTERLRMMQKFKAKVASRSPLALSPPPDEHAVREAVHKLHDPEHRLIDEFFWFWPNQLGQSNPDKALAFLSGDDIDHAAKYWSQMEQSSETYVSMHNLAVLFHCLALDLEQEALSRQLKEQELKTLGEHWVHAFKRWKVLLDHEPFWSRLTARIRALQDPRLTTGLARRVRASLPLALLSINAALAVRYAEAGNTEAAKRQVEIIGLWEGSGEGQAIPKAIPKGEQEGRGAMAEPKKTPALQAERNAEVIRSLTHNDPKVRKAAADRLGEEREVRALDALLHVLTQDVEPGCRATAAWALGRLGNSSAIHVLSRTALEDPDERVRREATAALDRIATKCGPLPLRLVGPVAQKALRDACEPLRQRVKSICKNAESQTEKDPTHADKVGRDVITHTESLLVVLDALLPPGDATRDAAHDEVAVCVVHCQISYGNKTEDWKVSLELLELALSIAVGQTVRDRIQENINTVKGNLEHSTCWFCEQNPTEDKAALDVKMYGDVARVPTWNGVQIQWRHGTVKVPRCAKCKSAHGRLSTYMGVGSVLGGVLGLGGCIAIVLNDEDTWLGGLIVFGALTGIGVGIGAAINAARCPKGVKPESAKSEFPSVKRLLGQGWQFGEKPNVE
jgi:hypothetical protein